MSMIYATDMQGYRGYSIRTYSDGSILVIFLGEEVSAANSVEEAKQFIDSIIEKKDS